MPTKIDFRRWPYGQYELADGSRVVFDRQYKPLVRLNDQGVAPCDPAERIEFIEQTWFYQDRMSPRRNRRTRERLQALVASIPTLAAELARRGQPVIAQ
jgi:hypothetical protein